MNETPPPSTVNSRYELTKLLETENKHLEGVRKDHFVDSPSLCATCKYGIVRRRSSQNTRYIHCTVFGRAVPEDISECGAHLGINALSLAQMVEIAHIIDDRSDRYKGYL